MGTLAAGTAATAAPAPAHADVTAAGSGTSAALSITEFYCDTGRGFYACSVRFTGGVAPYTIHWYRNNVLLPALDGSQDITASCVIGQFTSSRVSIVDAVGASVGRGTGFKCGFPA